MPLIIHKYLSKIPGKTDRKDVHSHAQNYLKTICNCSVCRVREYFDVLQLEHNNPPLPKVWRKV